MSELVIFMYVREGRRFKDVQARAIGSGRDESVSFILLALHGEVKNKRWCPS